MWCARGTRSSRTHGAYREQLPWGSFERSFKPRHSEEVRDAARFNKGDVVSATGARHLTKLVQPVPRGSAGIVAEGFARRQSAVVEERKRWILEPFARRVARPIGTGNEKNDSCVGMLLQRIGGFATASRDAGQHQKQLVAGVLRTSPERVSVTPPARGGIATVRAL